MKRIVSLFAAAFLAAPTLSLAAVADDEVTSQKLKEADGTSAQNTNSGSGVKTNHIQNGAVTAAKIASGTITAAQLATGSVGTTQLANGAVTDAKITGLISFSKLPTGTTSSTVAVGNHNHDATYLGKSPYAHVVVVAKNGAANGPIYSNLQNAINAAAAAIPTGGRALVKVMPGAYDLGTATLMMASRVDLEGSGAENTVIQSSVAQTNSTDCEQTTVRMASDSALRFLQVVNPATAPGTDQARASAIGFYGVAGKLEHVTVRLGGIAVPIGDAIGVCANGPAAQANLNEVWVDVKNSLGSGHAAMVFGGADLTVTSSRLTVETAQSAIDIINSDDTQGNASLANIFVANSILEGTGPGGGAAIYASAWNTDVVNPTVVLKGGTIGAFQADGAFRMVGTQFFTDGPVWYSISPGAAVRIAGSLLPGDRSALAGAKLVHCFDEAFNPIPNQ